MSWQNLPFSTLPFSFTAKSSISKPVMFSGLLFFLPVQSIHFLISTQTLPGLPLILFLCLAHTAHAFVCPFLPGATQLFIHLLSSAHTSLSVPSCLEQQKILLLSKSLLPGSSEQELSTYSTYTSIGA